MSCYNFRFFSLTAKVFPIFLILFFFNQTSCYAQMFFHFSVTLRRWFDDQDLIAVFNFFSMYEKSWKCGKDLFACFVDLEKV